MNCRGSETVKGQTVIQNGHNLIINGKTYDYPKNTKGQNVTIIDGNIYVNGYELINGEWKRTFSALWHKFF